MNNKLTKYNALLFALLICTTACFPQRVYEGPALGEDKVAILYPRAVDIYRIDDVNRAHFGTGISMLPGKHVIEAGFSASNFQAPSGTSARRIVSFNAVAGQRYYISGSTSASGRTCIWVEHLESGERITPGCGQKVTHPG